MHQPAQAELRHIHKTTEVAHVDDQPRIRVRLARLELGLQKGEELCLFAVPLGIAGIAFRLGNVIGRLL